MQTPAALLEALRDPAGSFLHLLTGALVSFVDGARADIEHTLDQHLFRTVDTSVPGGRPLTANPWLRRLNLGLAVAADVLLAAVLLFACLRSIFERTFRSRYSLKVMLPKLMLAIVLIHFSLPLMQMAIDLDNALSAVALSLGDPIHADSLPWSAVISHASTVRMSATEDLFHAVFAVVLVVSVVILVLAYVVRHALLGVLVVIAPLVALCTPLPDTRGYVHIWLRLFLVTVFMQPVQLIVLRVATVMAFDDSGGLVATLYALATLYLMLKVPGAMNTAAHLETKAETLGKHAQKALQKAAFHHGGSHRTASHATHTSHAR